jgi:hypothetical protein
MEAASIRRGQSRPLALIVIDIVETLAFAAFSASDADLGRRRPDAP